eukprot:COSAG01_NODE_1986_length_8712_cov_118.329618_9_plen_109_part_00
MDAMSDAIDMAEVVLYGVSLAYKESANCRLEANYAHQQEKEMIPLMMQKQYNVKGCKFFMNHHTTAPPKVLLFLHQPVLLSTRLRLPEHVFRAGFDPRNQAVLSVLGR